MDIPLGCLKGRTMQSGRVHIFLTFSTRTVTQVYYIWGFIWISTVQVHCTKHAPSPLLLMTQLGCELLSKTILNRSSKLHLWQRQLHTITSHPCLPLNSPSLVLASSSGPVEIIWWPLYGSTFFFDFFLSSHT